MTDESIARATAFGELRSEVGSLRVRVDRLEDTMNGRLMRIEGKVDVVLQRQAERAGGDRLFKFLVNTATIILAAAVGAITTLLTRLHP